jgi:hypothetical protein
MVALIVPCLITGLGTGITLAGSLSSHETLLGVPAAWTKLKELIRTRHRARGILVICVLVDFLVVLELTRWERYEILKSGQDVDFWYSPEQIAALGPGLLLLGCLGLLLNKWWSCGLAVLTSLFLLSRSLEVYSFLKSERTSMLTWEAWKRYVAISGGVSPQIRAALAVLVIAWSLNSIFDQFKVRRQPQSKATR